MTLPVAKIFPRNLAIAVSAIVCTAPLIWATALAHQRLGAAEERQREQTQWIAQQTVRIEKLESVLVDFRIMLERVDVNVQQLQREQRRGGARAPAGD